MKARRLIAANAVAALVVCGLAISPASGAPEAARASRAAPVRARAFGAFTPAAADPRLAAMIMRGGLADGFHFTPVETRRANRAVTVAVRSRAVRAAPTLDRPAETRTVGLAPVAYDLGVGLGWKSFAISGDLAHVDLAGQPGSRDAASVNLSYTLHRFTGRFRGDVSRPLAGAPPVAQEPQSYAVDVGGAYRLTHNLDVTAGLRYRSDRERVDRPEEDRHDSQAVYVGTAFRF